MSHRVLVAEDSATMRKSIEIALTHAAITLEFANSGDEALQKAQAAPPTLLLIDANIAGQDGYAISQSLKGNPATSAVKTCLLVSSRCPLDEARAQSSSIDHHVMKPFSCKILLDTMLELCGGAPAIAASQPAAAAPPPTAIPAPTPATPPPAPVNAAPPPAAMPTPAPAAAPTPIAPPAAMPTPAAAPPAPPKFSAPPPPPATQQPTPISTSSGAPLPPPRPASINPPGTPPLPPSGPAGISPTSQPLQIGDQDMVPIAPPPAPKPAVAAPTPVPTQPPPAAAPTPIAQPTAPAPITPPPAAPAVSSPTPQAAAPAASEGGGLTPDTQRLVEEAVWEIVPKLAEAMIRERIDELVKARGS